MIQKVKAHFYSNAHNIVMNCFYVRRYFILSAVTIILIAAFMSAMLLSVISADVAAAAVSDNDAQYAGEEVAITAVMYHSILKSKQGKYTISPAMFEEDLRIYRQYGYTAVFPSEIAAYARGEGQLPAKPLLITFDDGHYNNLFYAHELLQKHGMRALISPIGAFSQHSTESGDDSNPNYSHLTWEQIGIMSRSGIWEVGNHTYNMHAYKPRFGVSKMQGEGEEQYIAALEADFNKMQSFLKEKSGVEAKTFAYPFGKYTSQSKEILKKLGYEITLTCNEGKTVVKRGNIDSAFYIRRYNRDGNKDSAWLIEKILCSR